LSESFPLFEAGTQTKVDSVLVVNPTKCCPRGSAHQWTAGLEGGSSVCTPPVDEGTRGGEQITAPTSEPLHPLFAAIRGWDAAEVDRLVRLSLAREAQLINPMETMPLGYQSHGETFLMLAARLGNPMIVAALLQHPSVRSTIDVGNMERQYEIRASSPCIPSAMHYAIVGQYEQLTGISIDWVTQHPSRTAEQMKDIEPVVSATPEQGVDHARVLALLLEHGASPLSGSTGATPLHMAFEVGMIDTAETMLEAADCTALAYASTAHLAGDPNKVELGGWVDLVNLVHAASGVMISMSEPCRAMLRSESTGKDLGSYKVYGLTLENSPSIRQGICTRAEVFDVYFRRFSAQLELLVTRGFERCGLDTAVHMDEVSLAEALSPQLPAMCYAIMNCDHLTADVLLKYGSDPFLTTAFGSALHLAAHRGCHQIVGKLLTAANQKSSAELIRLSFIEDEFARDAAEVGLDKLSRCFVRMGQKGLAPRESDCPLKVEMGTFLDNLGKPDGAENSKEAAAAVIAASTATAPAAPKLRVGNMGWREYLQKAPLMHGMHTDGTGCDIVQIDGLMNSSEFYKRFQLINQPAIFRGGAADWPARTKWTPDYLTATIGKETVEASKIPYGNLDGVQTQHLSMADFLSQMLNSGPTNVSGAPPPYVFDREIMKLAASIKSFTGDLKLPRTFKDCEVQSLQLIIGPEGSGSPAHFHTAAFNALLFGRKRWLIYPPSIAFWSKKPALPWLMDGDAHGVPDEQPLECVQQPGDVVYVPAAWGHAVINLEDTVAAAMEIDEMGATAQEMSEERKLALLEFGLVVEE
jgi:histone arginine demethylase JMJD6